MDNFIITLTRRLSQKFDPQLIGKILADWLMNILIAVMVMAAFYLLWLIIRLALNLTLQLQPLSIEMRQLPKEKT